MVFLRPNLSAAMPQTKTPIMLPRKKTVWAIRGKKERSHTNSQRLTLGEYITLCQGTYCPRTVINGSIHLRMVSPKWDSSNVQPSGQSISGVELVTTRLG